jgi:16S rRNA (adenine1518-N6/adenine1519-N6)-dimethyltransferase
MKLSEMKQLLDERHLTLTKSLGQNFLHDRNQLRRIVDAAELRKTDMVLEIGPGLGPLTELLVEQAAQVLAIEKDARLVEVLKERFARELSQDRALQLIHADALELIRREPRDWDEWKLVANLPYSVASPILVELAQSERCPRCMVVTLQTEVARRLTAGPGGSDYGVLTLLVQLRYEPKGRFKIPAACFFPEPDVDSACVCLQRRPRPLLEPKLRPVFAGLVKRGFSQRRKMLLKLLKNDWPAEALETAWAELRLAPQARAETVTLEQFVRLTALLSPDRSPDETR